MSGLQKTIGLIALLFSTSASAALIEFSYIFDADSLGDSGQVLTGLIDGTVQSDGDTVVINSFLSASLGGSDYGIGAATGIRTGALGDTPMMSFSGDVLDFWVCPLGFSSSSGSDCDFGIEGGFLVSHIAFGSAAHAGHPAFGELYRASDRPLVQENWTAAAVPVPLALPLFLTALAGFFLRHRLQKTQSPEA